MRDDCPYLKPEAHDGAWEMFCGISGECDANWEEYQNCNKFKNKKSLTPMDKGSTWRG